MKKLLSLIVFLFSMALLVGCTGGSDNTPKPVNLTSQEKFELLQEMESPDFKVLQAIIELKGSVDVEGFAAEFDGKFSSYLNLTDRANVYNYTTLDIKLSSPEINVEGKGSLFLNLEGAYLDLNGYYSIGGTNVSVEGKEMMNLEEFTGGEMPQEVYDELLAIIPWDQFQELDYEDVEDESLEKLMDLISIYQDGDKTTLKISLTKAKLLELASEEIESDDEVSSIINSISNDSKIELSFEFSNKKFSKVSLSAVFQFAYEENDVDISGKIELLINPKAPSLPTSTQLATYNEVEMFTVFAPIFGFGMAGEPTK